MDEQAEKERPLSDTEYTAYQAFLVGYLYAALIDIQSSGQISAKLEKEIAESLKRIQPTLDRVYRESFKRPAS